MRSEFEANKGSRVRREILASRSRATPVSGVNLEMPALAANKGSLVKKVHLANPGRAASKVRLAKRANAARPEHPARRGNLAHVVSPVRQVKVVRLALLVCAENRACRVQMVRAASKV